MKLGIEVETTVNVKMSAAIEDRNIIRVDVLPNKIANGSDHEVEVLSQSNGLEAIDYITGSTVRKSIIGASTSSSH